MNVLLFGATGMVGQGVLRECLLDPDIHRVLTIGRTKTGLDDPKLQEIVKADMYEYATIEESLSHFDACFFCIGASVLGLSEERYARVTYDLTLAAATFLSQINPNMTFIYVSGAGTDGTERGKLMWTRVKGKTENALLRLPFKAAYMFRPSIIVPLEGIQSKTPAYRLIYKLCGPFFALLKTLFPQHILTTEQVGRAMIMAAQRGAPQQRLEAVDLYELSKE